MTTLSPVAASRIALRSGSTGADVVRVQRALNAWGTPYLTVTGTYDAPTAAAVGAYQRSIRLPVTRTVGSATWAALVAGRR